MWEKLKQNWYMNTSGHKKGARINIQPRFKIQYPMKNQNKFNA